MLVQDTPEVLLPHRDARGMTRSSPPVFRCTPELQDYDVSSGIEMRWGNQFSLFANASIHLKLFKSHDDLLNHGCANLMHSSTPVKIIFSN